MGVTMFIRQARTNEVEQVMQLLAEGVRWLRGRGLDQWSTWQGWRTKVVRSLERGEVWLLADRSELVGTVTIELSGDPDFWTPAELAEPAGYVSKLTIRRDRAGYEMGALLLAWAGDHVYRHGGTWVRLDAWKTNGQLHDYYRNRGWTYLRTSPDPRRRSGALFQTYARPLSHQDRARLTETPEGPAFETECRNTGDENPAGNWQPDHVHVGGLTVDYQWVGPRPARFVDWLRYRVRQINGQWIMEANQIGSYWKHHGQVLSAGWPLMPGIEYTITHGSNCQMVITERGVSELGVTRTMDYDSPGTTDLGGSSSI